ncbi:MAG: methyltransferase domain-containing protein [Planctomycetota bacterium]|jgi:ubiquinone/menaquinone biosynthesis C-methylase UbiE
MKRLGIVAIVMLVVIPAFADVIEDSGIKGGIIVQVGCKDAKSLASLLVNEKYLVHGLDVDAKKIARIRDSLRSDHLYGKVSAAVYDGKNLPYTDNLVNLLVIEDSQCNVQEKEILRVLVPGGVAMVCGRKTTKPVPSSIDEWTHFLHGADNNAVVKDTVVAAPRTIQWVSNPRWARSHEEASSQCFYSIHGCLETGGSRCL